jgi:hypothetical protein
VRAPGLWRRRPYAAVMTVTVLATGCTGHPDRPARGGAVSTSPSASTGETPATPSTPGRPSTPARPPGVPNPAKVNRHDATAVARATVITMSAIDTATDDPDTFERDARLRTLPYLTTAYAAQIGAEPSHPAPMSVWRRWSAHHAYLRVRLTTAGVDGHPADTATTASRIWQVTTTPTGRDGWHAAATAPFTAFVTLTRNGPGGPWQVTQCSLQS